MKCTIMVKIQMKHKMLNKTRKLPMATCWKETGREESSSHLRFGYVDLLDFALISESEIIDEELRDYK